MNIFNFMNKNKNDRKVSESTTQPSAVPEHLTADGELPFGWVSRNKDFTEKINNEYSYFLDTWLESKNKSPYEQRNALKSFVMYLDDVEKLCMSKGECFVFWFRHILTSEDYTEKRKADLAELCDGIDKKQEIYTERQYLLPKLDTMIAEKLVESEGIIQTEFVKLFSPAIQEDVKKRLYELDKEGIIERAKAGRSYALLIKK